jgi:hypothetical protein
MKYALIGCDKISTNYIVAAQHKQPGYSCYM